MNSEKIREKLDEIVYKMCNNPPKKRKKQIEISKEYDSYSKMYRAWTGEEYVPTFLRQNISKVYLIDNE